MCMLAAGNVLYWDFLMTKLFIIIAHISNNLLTRAAYLEKQKHCGSMITMASSNEEILDLSQLKAFTYNN